MWSSGVGGGLDLAGKGNGVEEVRSADFVEVSSLIAEGDREAEGMVFFLLRVKISGHLAGGRRHELNSHVSGVETKAETLEEVVTFLSDPRTLVCEVVELHYVLDG